MSGQAYAVLGSGFGDCGKGAITDYLARKGNGCTNVRFNGGAQAGHTVVDGQRRHVFSHVGSGTFAGAATFLSSRFIVNPFVLSLEFAQLARHGYHPTVEVHPDAVISTVFDMVLNGVRELSRGEHRHGSCCLGINETVTRHLDAVGKRHSVTASDLMTGKIHEKMTCLYNLWYKPRLAEYLGSRNPEVQDLLSTANLSTEISNLEAARDLLRVSWVPSMQTSRALFEGAQGLELDEFLGSFPHVTRSITGLPAALLAASEIGVDEITPIYVTRCYKTRHGAGPLPHEGEVITSKPLVDKTNKTGKWQGAFRFAPLDTARILELIQKDMRRATPVAELLRIKVHPWKLAVTCLDQVDVDLNYYVGDTRRRGLDSLLDELSTNLNLKYLSWGAEKESIYERVT